MNAKTVSGSAIILTLAFVLAAEYKNAPGRPSDFRDAVNSEGAVEQLQKAAPGDQDPDQPAIPSPQEAGAAAAEPSGSAAAAAQSAAGDQSVKRIFSENDPWHKRLAQALGIDYPCTVETKHLGSPRQQTEKLTLDDGRVKESVVVKHYGRISRADRFRNRASAVYMRVTSLFALNYEADAVKMFNNGVAMGEKFKNAGLKTLDIVLTDVLTDPKHPIVVTKFLKGADMPTTMQAALQGDTGAMQAVKQLGSALAKAHRNNFSIGDLNSGNVMFVNGEPYFIDVDRASVGGRKGWDIALVAYYPVLVDELSGEPQAWELVSHTFLQGYLTGGGDVSVIKDALSRKYIGPLASLYATKGKSATRAVRREMKKAAGEGPAEESDEALGLAP